MLPDESGGAGYECRCFSSGRAVGTQAVVLLLALRGQIALYVSKPILTEYEEVLHLV